MNILKKQERKMVFVAQIKESLANAIRKYVGEIPVLSVEDVEIHKNGSPLYDETVAHRIGLVPLKQTAVKKEGNVFKISSSKEGFVCAKEIVGEIEPIYEDMPITYLDKGQELEITGRAVKGKGNDHSKFSPGNIFYRRAKKIILEKKVLDLIKKSCSDAEIKEKGDKIIILDDKEKEVGDLCEGIAEKENSPIEIEEIDELVLNIESFGQIGPDEIFSGAVKALKKDIDEFLKRIK